MAFFVVEGRTVTLTITPGSAADPMTGIYLRPRSVIEPMAAHIHRGAAGVVGRLVVEFPWTFSVFGPSVTMAAQAPRSFAAKVAASPQGYYVDVHTSSYPAGAARGQLHAPIARPGPADPSPLPPDGQALQPGLRIGAEVQLPRPGAAPGGWPPAPLGAVPLGRYPWSGTWPAPRPPKSPSRMTWEFFFHHFTRADELAADLTEVEAPVLRQVAGDCVEALGQLDANQKSEETPGSAADEPDPPPDERSRILEAHIAQLRSRLGEAAFVSLDGYVRRRFEDDEDDADPPGQPPRRRRADQTLKFRPISYKIYRDPDFTLEASASSGLHVYFTASGDCSVLGSAVHILSAGNCWLTAHQPGNEGFNPAPDVVQQLRIGKASQRISAPAVPPRTYLDSDFPVGATASSGLLVVINAVGRCSVDWGIVHLLGAGTCFLSAHQPGSSNYTAAPIVDQELPRIARADQTISLPTFDDPSYGPADLRLEPRASSGLAVRISTEGMCTFTGTCLRILGSGTCKLTAEQPGNVDFNAAPTEIRVFEVVWRDPAPAPGSMEGEP